MKSTFINDMRVGEDLIDEPLLVRDLIRRTTKDDRLYYLLTFGDSSGQIGGIFWDVPEQVDAWMRPGKVGYITGKVNRYKEVLQVAVTDAYPVENPDLSLFMPSSIRSQTEMVAELKRHVSDLAEPWKSLLTKLLLQDPFLTRYTNSPAAKTMHHATVGGLLEHSLSMANLAVKLANHYPHVDQDLLVAGALLHDMGKVWEYSFDGAFDISADGRLIGHITRAALEIEKAAADLEPPLEKSQLQDLLHLILSHHGTMEWGSPVTPKTLEAILLHQLDLLDSRVQGYFDYLSNDSDDSGWSVKASPMHDTNLRRPPGWTA